MNIDQLIYWGETLLAFLDAEKEHHVSRFDEHKLKEYLFWVLEFRDCIQEWSTIINLVKIVEHHIRSNGYNAQSPAELELLLSQLTPGEKTSRIKNNLLSFIEMESKKANPEEILIGSSEIIESLFGKQKVLEGEQASSGFTGLILAITSFV